MVAARLKWLLLVWTAATALAAPAQAAASDAGGPISRTARFAPATGAVGGIATRTAALPATDAIWSWCGIFDAAQKPVRTFERYRGDAGNGHWIRGGTSVLHCGSSAKWGYRHIVARHQSQWEYDAWLVGTNWRNQADFAIATVLHDPDRVTYNPDNDTCCYSGLIYLEDKRDRRVVEERRPNVVVSARTKNIITAFPSNANCRQVK